VTAQTLNGRISISAELPFDYCIRESQAGKPKELILLLHGFNQSGEHIFSKLESVLPADALVLAPNAPFPYAERKDAKYRMAYSWYFYDFETDEFIINMSTALEFLESGIKTLGYGELPLRIIGFSQGGYLAPFLGQRLSQTKHVIALHSTYLYEELGPRLEFRADNVVGADDAIVDPAGSERSFSEIFPRALSGEFYRVPGGVHRIDEQVRAKVGELIRKGV
jgi:predicted esterase